MEDMGPDERAENERLIKEIFSSERQTTAFDLFALRVSNRHNSVFKTLKVLELADYGTKDLKDRPTKMLGGLLTSLGVCGLLYRRRPIVRTAVQCGAALMLGLYLTNLYGIEQVLYKQALFNDDQRSQEIRLLINHFNPQNKYREMIVDKQMQYLNKLK